MLNKHPAATAQFKAPILNAASWLAGMMISGSAGSDVDRLATRMLKTILGPAWSWRRELERCSSIAERLARDQMNRIVSSLIFAGVTTWLGLYAITAIWLSVILFNELLEDSLRRGLRGKKVPERRRVIVYMAHLMLGSTSWCAMAAVLWFTEDASKMYLATVLLIGTLIHVAILYSESRLLTLAAATPALIVIMTVTLATALHDTIPAQDKALIVLSMATVVTYLASAAVHNIQNSELLKGLLNKTERLASEDPLTGLKNRRSFLDGVHEIWARKTPFYIVFIDLDRFKPLNDEFGHAVGDQVLHETGRRLLAAPGAICASRLGGDEFAVLIDATCDSRDAHDKVLRLQESLISRIDSDAGEVFVGASMGYAVSHEDGESVSKLLHAADTAMRRAKTERCGVARFDPALDEAALSPENMEQAFIKALRSGQIRAALQPIARASDGRIVSHEMLARWEGSGFARNPSPQEFIPIAEKLGLLNTLLWTTLEQALPYIADADARLAINVSPSQLTSTLFLQRLKEIIDCHGVRPEAIEIEITEQVAFRNVEDNADTLRRAKEMGFTIVLDDFGTGYSSLSMLDALPLDKLKLDRAFIERTKNQNSGGQVLGATIRLAKELGLVCCVEGVEEGNTADLVRALGCDQIQGYWVGRPIVPEEDARPQCVNA